MKKLCIPSSEIEATTRASAPFVFGVVCLLAGCFGIPILFMTTLLKGDYNLVLALGATCIMLACIVPMVLSPIPILSALYPLITSYCIEDGKITKGRLCERHLPLGRWQLQY